MKLRPPIAINLVLIGLLLSSCAPKEIHSSLSAADLQKIGLLYLALNPRPCDKPLENITFSSITNSQSKTGYETQATTTYSPGSVDIGFTDIGKKTDLQLISSVSHETPHACADPDTIFEIEPVQEIAHLDENDATIYRIMSEQVDGGLFMDLTVRYKNAFGIPKEIYVPFEEIFAYFFGVANIEKVYGQNSDEAIYARNTNIHSSSSNVLKGAFDAAGVDLNKLAEYKSMADAKSIIAALKQGFQEIGLQNGIDEKNTPPSQEYFIIQLLADAYQYQANEQSDEDGAKSIARMADSLKQFYYGRKDNLGTDQIHKILNILKYLLLNEKANSGNLDLKHAIVVNEQIIIPQKIQALPQYSFVLTND